MIASTPDDASRDGLQPPRHRGRLRTRIGHLLHRRHGRDLPGLGPGVRACRCHLGCSPRCGSHCLRTPGRRQSGVGQRGCPGSKERCPPSSTTPSGSSPEDTMDTASRVVIRMDPHKRSVTIKEMTKDEYIVGTGRFERTHAWFDAQRECPDGFVDAFRACGAQRTCPASGAWPSRIGVMERSVGSSSPADRRHDALIAHVLGFIEVVDAERQASDLSPRDAVGRAHCGQNLGGVQSHEPPTMTRTSFGIGASASATADSGPSRTTRSARIPGAIAPTYSSSWTR